MLLLLQIKNYVIIDTLDLDFQSGMTVISGETGAGKSIIMDALELAIGARADSHVIRQGESRCEISALFDISHNPSALQWLHDNDLILEDNTCIFRRIITNDGRSKSTINGHIFPVQKTRELAQYLVDIHGQHEHQSLLKIDTHRMQLDLYAQHQDLVNAVETAYKTRQKIAAELETLSSQSSDANTAEQALLQYQWDELHQAAVSVDEIAEINQSHQRLSQADSWISQAQAIQVILASDEEASVQKMLSTALNLLPKENIPDWINIQQLLDNAQIQCQEAENALNTLLNHLESDPEKLQHIENRLHQLHALARKHRTTMEELPALQEALTEKLVLSEKNAEKIAVLTAALAEAEKNYHTHAHTLSESRKKHAMTLGDAITQFIRQLGLIHGYLIVMLDTQPEFHAYGYDKVEYHLVTNPDQPPRPLAKIASGGELSRISLAIEMVTTQAHQDLTRLFDEVDVGIGGQTAAIVGQLLRQLGEKAQVLCITHQPQTAGQGHHHFYVEKKIVNQVTHFHVKTLNHAEKIQEIARMLGGLEMTENTLSHAAELVVL